MPALTNSRFGSSSNSEALGTTVWSRWPKWAKNLLRISAVSIGDAFPGRLLSGDVRHRRRRRRDRGLPRGTRAQLLQQLGLTVGHARLDLVGEHPSAGS